MHKYLASYSRAGVTRPKKFTGLIRVARYNAPHSREGRRSQGTRTGEQNETCGQDFIPDGRLGWHVRSGSHPVASCKRASAAVRSKTSLPTEIRWMGYNLFLGSWARNVRLQAHNGLTLGVNPFLFVLSVLQQLRQLVGIRCWRLASAARTHHCYTLPA